MYSQKYKTRREINKTISIASRGKYLADYNLDILRTAILNYLVESLIKKIGNIKIKRVLFVGGGSGREIMLFLKRIDSHVVNLDINFELLKFGKDLNKNPSTCFYVLGDGMSMPFKDNSFDVVILYESLHHMDDIEACLLESIRCANLVCIVDRRKCFISKLGRLCNLIKPDYDGLYANEIDLNKLTQFINHLPLKYNLSIKFHFIYLAIINKYIHKIISHYAMVANFYLYLVKIINFFFGFLGNGVIITINKI
jgi:ubiquinone/menaquinone biosynthesis C-methylase UbiE